MLESIEVEDNNLNFETVYNSNITPSVLSKLQNEIHNMGLSLKINVQLLSRKNALQFEDSFHMLANKLADLLVEKGKQVEEGELYQIIYQNLHQALMCENERLFRMEYDVHFT